MDLTTLFLCGYARYRIERLLVLQLVCTAMKTMSYIYRSLAFLFVPLKILKGNDHDRQMNTLFLYEVNLVLGEECLEL